MAENEPKRRVTLKEVAQAMGLHNSSVSLALRNSPEISPATRERIKAVARQMGYQPNPMASGLAQFRRNSKTVPIRATLAWINAWPDPTQLRGYREFELYWQGALKSAEKFGYHLEEFVVNQEMSIKRTESVLRARGVEAILIPPHGDLDVDWSALRWERFSAVRFGHTLDDLPFHSVTADQAANGSLAFRKIWEKGYKRIGFVGDKTPRRVFVGGFLQAQLDVAKGLRLPPLLWPGNENPEVKKKLFAAWLEKTRPDAIFTEVPALPRMLQEEGYGVPKDIGLAGASLIDIDVNAGIDQQAEEIGRVAVLVLMSLINDHDRGAPPIHREILIKGKWVDGSSLPSRR